MAAVPIRVHTVTRPSRLMRSIPEYIRQSTLALLRGVALYRPRLAWGLLALISVLPIIAIGAWETIHVDAVGWSPWALGFGLVGMATGGVAIWRWGRRAAQSIPHLALESPR